MSKIIESYERTVQSERIVQVLCDWCGGDVRQSRGYGDREFTLEFKEGESYPDGGFAEGWQIEDLCDNCVERLRQLLIAQGIRVSTVEIDW